jgi:parallel beta-helix repeat protein
MKRKILIYANLIISMYLSAQCPADGATVMVTSDLTLPSGCVAKRVTFSIPSGTNNIVLDGNGIELNGLDTEEPNAVDVPYATGTGPTGVAVRLYNDVTNVTVKNFVIKNYHVGIQLLSGYNTTFETRWDNGEDNDALKAEYQAISPRNNSILNNKIINAHQSGIHVFFFANNNLIQGNTVVNSSYSGIYISPYASNNKYFSNRIFECGYKSWDRTTLTTAASKREGIAVDSSDSNDFFNNVFTNNAGGGIFLYKNCRENIRDTTINHPPRENPSSNNIIRRNDFFNQDVGVSIAPRNSRPYTSRCGDDLMYEYKPSFWSDPTGYAYVLAYRVYVANDSKDYNDDLSWPIFYRDFSTNNTVTENLFRSDNIGVRVQDDDNQVINNTFIGAGATEHVYIGAGVRKEALGINVTGVARHGNHFLTPANTDIRVDQNVDFDEIMSSLLD